ncbi:MAG: DUF3822 family protein [Paludibacter sp.]|nr:DUF3822 family protein [Paludibacter sp.]
MDNACLVFRPAECVLYMHSEFGGVVLQHRWTLDLWHAAEDDFVRVLAKATEIQQNTAKLQIICQSAHFVFVPLAMFVPEDAHYFLNFEKKTENSVLCSNIIKEKEIVAVFVAPQTLVKALSRIFDDAKILLHLTPIIENKQNTNENFVQIFFAENTFDVLVFKNNQLNFYNSFKFNTKEDVLYFLTAIFEQLSLNFEQTEIFIYNEINQKNTVEFLKKSFKIKIPVY